MKEVPLSTCERDALEGLVAAGLRSDHRGFLEPRPTTITFGREYGSCSVTLGETRVLAQVTCEVVEPRASRPQEGKLMLSIHLSPMAAPHIELGRGGAEVESLTQILDRNIKESRCLDMESLCIRAEESVWQLRVDVTILNHGGNLGDAANLAAVGALRHFHRPDVSVGEDGRVTILSPSQSSPIPTIMRKIPVCITYALLTLGGKCHALMDPTNIEERVMAGRLVVGLNPHGDITSLVFPGRVALQKEEILGLLDHAFVQAKAIAERVHQAVEDDLNARIQDPLDRSQGFTNKLISDEEFKRQRYLKILKNKPTGKFVVPKEEEATTSEEISTIGNHNPTEDLSRLVLNSPVVAKEVSATSPHKDDTQTMSDDSEEECQMLDTSLI